jgi:hypothetical protein
MINEDKRVNSFNLSGMDLKSINDSSLSKLLQTISTEYLNLSDNSMMFDEKFKFPDLRSLENLKEINIYNNPIANFDNVFSHINPSNVPLNTLIKCSPVCLLLLLLLNLIKNKKYVLFLIN